MCILQFQHQIFIILWEMNVSIYNCGYQHCEHSPCIFCVFKFLKVTLNKNKTRFIVKYWMSKLEWLVFLSVFPSLAQLLWASSPSWHGCSLPLPWSEQGSTCLPSQAEVQIKKKKNEDTLNISMCEHRKTKVIWVYFFARRKCSKVWCHFIA